MKKQFPRRFLPFSRLLIMMVFFITSGLFCAGCSDSTPGVIRLEGETMGTFYQVTINKVPKGENLITLQGKIDKILDRVNDLMSTYQDDSELMEFNKHNSTEWFRVQSEVVDVVQEAQRVSQLSDGAFDITVGPLVEKWNFGVPQEEFIVPAQAELDALSDRVGYQLVEFRESSPALRKQHPEVFLNLSAIAKGYGVDRIGAVMEHVELSNYLINIGGEMLAKGTKPDGSPWSVGIEQPAEEAQSAPQLLKKVTLNNRAMATSGNYRNYFEAPDGKRYSHTIDPRTRRPVEHRLLSVSVLAESCMTADALATALMVLGPTEAAQFAEKQQTPVFLVYEDETGQQIEQASPAFEAYIQENSVQNSE